MQNGLTERFRRLLNGLWGDLLGLDARVGELDREIALVAQSDPAAKRLQHWRPTAWQCYEGSCRQA
jgi:hypothetical protein